MSENIFADVTDFHEKMGVPVNQVPHIPAPSEMELRRNLIREEYREFLEALINEDLVEIADGLGDMLYTIIGTMLVMGLPVQEVWDEIQRTNMAKEPNVRRGDGKILKPRGWTPPDIGRILRAHGADLK
jgi:predicted HAD superfamily Cof-like phosphohydrolase